MSKTHNHRAALLAVCLMIITPFALVACSSPEAETPSDTGSASASETQPDNSQPSEQTDGQTSEPAEPAPAEEPAAPSYGGTDPNEIITQLCAIAGCHDSASLLAYSADPDAVQRKMESMGGPDYSNLTPEQIQALVDFYNAQ